MPKLDVNIQQLTSFLKNEGGHASIERVMLCLGWSHSKTYKLMRALAKEREDFEYFNGGIRFIG